MANISNYLEEKLLNHVMRGESYSSPTNVYVGIVSDSATESELESGDLINELDGYDGDRKSVSFTEPSQVDGKATIENTNLIEFEDMPEGEVEYAFVADSATKGQGNILYWMPLKDSKFTNEGDILRLVEGELTLSLD